MLVDTLSQLSVVQAIPTLIEQALRQAGEGADNTTAIGMMWELEAQAASEEAVMTDTLPLNAFTTSILSTTAARAICFRKRRSNVRSPKSVPPSTRAAI